MPTIHYILIIFYLNCIFLDICMDSIEYVTQHSWSWSKKTYIVGHDECCHQTTQGCAHDRNDYHRVLHLLAAIFDRLVWPKFLTGSVDYSSMDTLVVAMVRLLEQCIQSDHFVHDVRRIPSSVSSVFVTVSKATDEYLTYIVINYIDTISFYSYVNLCASNNGLWVVSMVI